MKKKLFFLIIFLGFKIAVGQTVVSSCSASASVVALYKDDADRLAVRKIFRIGSNYMDSIKISKLWSDTVLNALVAVYNATTLPARDSVVTMFNVHTFPNPVLNKIEVSADSNLAWMHQLQNNIIPTGNLSVDSLISDNNLHLSSYQNWFHFMPYQTAILQSDSNLNIVALANKFLSLPGVFYAEPSIYAGDGNEIQDSIYPTFVELNYSYGWGDCEAGCISRHFWKFRVFHDCSVEFVGSYGTPLPAGSPASLTISETHVNVSCFGFCDGFISITPSGGVPPYVYSGLPSGPVCAGTYPITVTDIAGSTASVTVIITEPPLLTVVVSSIPASCGTCCDGTASVIASGGTPGYSYLWSPTGGFFPGLPGLCPGTYTCCVTDANGCVTCMLKYNSNFCYGNK